MSQKRVLFVFNALREGGISNVIINICRNLQNENITFDLLKYEVEIGKYEEEFKQLGGEIYEIPIKRYKYKCISRFIQLFTKLRDTIKLLNKLPKYDVIHCHQSFEGGIIMLVAYLLKIPIRISHSHFSNLAPQNNLDKLYKKFLRILINRYSTHKVGCSNEACKWLYGEKEFNKKNTITIYNGIDLEKFNPNIYNKYENKKELKINASSINIVHVGRFVKEKNHEFLIDVFSELVKINSRYHLTLVGFGELEEAIKDKIKQLKLENKTTICPADISIPFVLASGDLAIFPSQYEGLGIALLEFQAMGLLSYASNTIPEEVNLGLCKFIDLKKSPKDWAQFIDQDRNDEIINMYNLELVSQNNMIKGIKEIYG